MADIEEVVEVGPGLHIDGIAGAGGGDRVRDRAELLPWSYGQHRHVTTLPDCEEDDEGDLRRGLEEVAA